MAITQKPEQANIANLVDAVVEVGRQRAALLRSLKAALQCGNNEEALRLSRELCGLSNDEESNRANPSIN